MTTIDVSVSLGVDDGYSSTAPAFTDTAGQLLIGQDASGFILTTWARFQSVTIAQGVIIDAAYLTVEASSSAFDGSAMLTNLYFNDVDDADAPTDEPGHNAKVRTTEFTAWDGEDFVVDTPTNSPSIVSVIQEIVDRPGWSSGNDMMLLWDDDGSPGPITAYEIHSFEGSGNDIILHIEYTATATDPTELVRTLLSDNWSTVNTDSHQPLFVTSVDPEVLSSRNQDVIKVYESRPRTKRRADHRYDYATYIAQVTVQVDIGFTPTDITLPTHSARVLEEVERRIQAGRSNPDEYWDLLETDTFTFQHQYRNFARNIMNVNCKRIVRQIPGT
jgi:hypothetical protein